MRVLGPVVFAESTRAVAIFEPNWTAPTESTHQTVWEIRIDQRGGATRSGWIVNFFTAQLFMSATQTTFSDGQANACGQFI